MNISITIPTYNEEKRIRRTIEAYHHFFSQRSDTYITRLELVVVLNGCTDNTKTTVTEIAARLPSIHVIELAQAGKGLAVKAGFLDALTRDNDLIGFVDADMATAPDAFYQLVTHIGSHDGIIASRYMPGSRIYPPRPWIKRWGSKLLYESLIRLLFGMHYHDYQCGAKLFTRHVISQVAPRLTIAQWAFDVELLYLCKLRRCNILEFPTVWHDQADSKLRITSGLRMLINIIRLRLGV
jgi:glycosyltransferase involved in cell wall biosynthesis